MAAVEIGFDNYVRGIRSSGPGVAVLLARLTKAQPPDMSALEKKAFSVRLTDFGLAKVAHGERTRTGRLRGKYPYMSPEQVSQRPVDARSDVFALGILMFEILAGVRPFDGKTDIATQMNIAAGERPRLEDRRTGLPRGMIAFVDAMLEVRPERRSSSADGVLDALSAFPVPANVVRALGALASACP